MNKVAENDDSVKFEISESNKDETVKLANTQESIEKKILY